MSKTELEDIRDEDVREIVRDWVEDRGGNPKKAFPPYPKRGRKGPEIRKVRLWKKLQSNLAVRVATGYADKYENHHMAIYRLPDGKIDFEVVKLFDAAQRLAKREDIVRHKRDNVERKYGKGTTFEMSLSQGDALQFPEGDEVRVRTVESIWANGQVVMIDHNDATGTTKSQPGAKSIIESGAKKISIDPIGRRRPAKD